MKNYLGIDWGKSKVGLAFSDGETKIAFPYVTLKNDKRLVDEIVNIVDDLKITDVVIGVSDSVKYKKEFKEEKKLGDTLEARAEISVKYQSEMFTTKTAEANLIEKGVKKIKRFDDEESARIILQEWLDNN
jgi:putative Holliday junction resolvase